MSHRRLLRYQGRTCCISQSCLWQALGLVTCLKSGNLHLWALPVFNLLTHGSSPGRFTNSFLEGKWKTQALFQVCIKSCWENLTFHTSGSMKDCLKWIPGTANEKKKKKKSLIFFFWREKGAIAGGWLLCLHVWCYKKSWSFDRLNSYRRSV